MGAMQRRDAEGAEEAGDPKGKTLVSKPVVSLALAMLVSAFGFQMLLSVVPLYAATVGGWTGGAGLATATFMLSTVLTQVAMPKLLGRFGYHRVLVAGLIFLGLPALLYPLAGGVAGVLAVTLLRGVGFGIITVGFAALIVELAPPERRGEALGLFGVAMTLPTIFSNPLGLWLVDASGYTTVFFLGGLLPLLALLAIAGISTGSLEREDVGGAGFLDGLRRGPLLRLVLIFATVTSATGVVVTFLPLAVPASGLFSPASALLVFGLTSTFSRLWAGRFGDRRDPHLLLIPGLVAAAGGMIALPQGGPPTLVGALLLGTGVGLLQNSTLILIMDRVADDERGLGSTLWNVSFDAGTGIGAFSFGFLVSVTGLPSAFYISALILLAAIALVFADHRHKKPTPHHPTEY
jgi:predicted MFS family arabinose efflux permease